jgi:hypothetical protein
MAADKPTAQRLTRLFALAVFVVAAVLASSSSAATPSRPGALVLTAADIPGNLRRVEAAVTSNATIAKNTSATAAQLSQWERITGYQSQFVARDTPKSWSHASVYVLSAVNICKTVRGGHAYFQHARRGLNSSEVAAIGDEAFVSTTTSRTQGITLVTYSIVWRSGEILALLYSGGVKGRYTLSDALRLARKQQAKITAAG